MPNASNGSRPNCASEIERHILSGYLARLPDRPRPFAIIVRYVRATFRSESSYSGTGAAHQFDIAECVDAGVEQTTDNGRCFVFDNHRRAADHRARP